MPRYLPIQPDAAYDQILDTYREIEDELGFVPNFLKTLAHSPDLLEPVARLYVALLKTGELSEKLRSLVLLKTCKFDRCKPTVIQFTQMALDAGWSEEQIKALDDFADSDLFNFYEKDVLRLIEESLTHPDDISQAQFWTQLDNHFTADQVVEMLTLIGFANMLNRFIQVVEVEPDPAPQKA